MRALLVAACLAGLLAVTSAGPINKKPGCHPGDTVQNYRIQGSQFIDFVRRNFVDMAYIQARKRGRDIVEAQWPRCTYIGHTPLRACYNSVDPGALGPPQITGQYGFKWLANLRCPGGDVSVTCHGRLNTNRSNRPWAVPGRPGNPSFWGAPNVKCA